ncbi:MAG: hypothetical protein BGO31_12215 [Bacteroidetes bacterium 43-16]|nr:MAG: hypothetical protein BGO31_12215 [Bacteroidetes bacterium 43-16]
MESHLSEALAIVDLYQMDNFDYIRITMFEERRIIRKQRTEKIILIMKAHVLQSAVFRTIHTQMGIKLTYSLH